MATNSKIEWTTHTRAKLIRLTPLVKRYIRNVARGHIVAMTEREMYRHDDRRDAMWAKMTAAEQTAANRIVSAAFGPFC